jgi:hypothetical protein
VPFVSSWFISNSQEHPMKALRGVGLVLGGALAWVVTLRLATALALAYPLGLFVQVAALGLPAFFAAALAYRWRLPQPLIWTVAGYCLGSGLDTAFSYVEFCRSTGEAWSVGRCAQAFAMNALSLGVEEPVAGGGFAPVWGNMLWLATVIAVGLYGIDTYRNPQRGAAPKP